MSLYFRFFYILGSYIALILTFIEGLLSIEHWDCSWLLRRTKDYVLVEWEQIGDQKFNIVYKENLEVKY